MSVYLIHFDTPYEHARHYLGYAAQLEERLAHHRNGSGANLLRVLKEANIGWRVVRVWQEGDRTFERRIKNSGSVGRACPECNPAPRYAGHPHYDP